MPSPVAFITATYLPLHSASLVSSLNRLRPQMAGITLVSAPIAPRGHQWWSKQFLLRGSERRKRLPPPPCFMGSITQDDGIGMNNAAAPCSGLEYDVRHLCVRWHKREGAKVTSERSKTRLGKKKRKAAAQQLKQQRVTGLLNKLHWTPALCRSHLLCWIVFTAELLFAFVCSCSGLRWRCRGMFYSKENYMSVYDFK